MAKPNLINATSIYAKSMVHAGSGTSTTVLSCPANKAYRITCLVITGTGTTTSTKSAWDCRLNRAGVATGAPTFGTVYSGGTFQNEWVPAEGNPLALPVGWVMNETDTLVIKANTANVTLIGWEEIDDA